MPNTLMQTPPGIYIGGGGLGSGGASGGTNPLRLSEIIKLPCWHPCVPNAKKGPGYNV